MDADRIREVAQGAVRRMPRLDYVNLNGQRAQVFVREPDARPAHAMLRDAFHGIPAGAAARLIADALSDAYGQEIGRAVAACVSAGAE